MEAIDPGTWMNMGKDEKELWIESIRAELKSFKDLEVFDEVTSEEVRTMKQGVVTQRNCQPDSSW
eukprot:11327380-Prorocentrum_lima.AAC.1